MKFLANVLLGWASFLISICTSTLILTLCWNQVIPVMLGLPEINLFQAFCLSWVSAALIKPYVLNRYDFDKN